MLKPNTMNNLRLLVADDHQMFRAGISNLLRTEEGFEIIGGASNGEEAVQMAVELQPDVVLMDIHLPKLDGISATQKITEAFPNMKILALTSSEEENYVVGMIRSGAKGYILKDAPIDELVLAIKTLAKGSSYFAKEISATIFALLDRAEVVPTFKQKAKRLEITGRELEVLQCIAEELSNKEIAAKLFISPRTVETHRRNLIQKLRVKNTAGLVRFYINNIKKINGKVLVSNG